MTDSSSSQGEQRPTRAELIDSLKARAAASNAQPSGSANGPPPGRVDARSMPPDPSGIVTEALVSTLQQSLITNIDRLTFAASTGATTRARELIEAELKPRTESLDSIAAWLNGANRDLRSITKDLNESASVSVAGQKAILENLSSRCDQLALSLKGLEATSNRLKTEVEYARQCMNTSDAMRWLRDDIVELRRQGRVQRWWFTGVTAATIGTLLWLWIQWPADKTNELVQEFSNLTQAVDQVLASNAQKGRKP